jgi:hypothetical protein
MDEDWNAVPQHLTVDKSLKNWAKGRFTMQGEQLKFDGRDVPRDFNKRVLEMVAKGESPDRLFKFWERLQKNPSMRSVEQLFPFLSHQGIPITANGTFLAYKGVKHDYTDCHTGKISNKPGLVHEMPRNQISDDPNEACHVGFHVGALGYAKGFGKVVVICEVDPEHVVCVPYDAAQQKMRVCKYLVKGHHNGEVLDTTSYDEDVADETDDVQPNPVLVNEETTVTEQSEADDASQKVTKPTKKKVKSFSALSMTELMEESIADLRQYAGKKLKIVGASKIPGGKTALVQMILKHRT